MKFIVESKSFKAELEGCQTSVELDMGERTKKNDVSQIERHHFLI